MDPVVIQTTKGYFELKALMVVGSEINPLEINWSKMGDKSYESLEHSTFQEKDECLSALIEERFPLLVYSVINPLGVELSGKTVIGEDDEGKPLQEIDNSIFRRCFIRARATGSIVLEEDVKDIFVKDEYKKQHAAARKLLNQPDEDIDISVWSYMDPVDLEKEE